MKYSLRKLDIKENNGEIFNIYSSNGYILVSSFKQNLSYPDITRNNFKLKRTIENSGFNHIPVWMEVFEVEKKLYVKVQVYVIVNSKKGTVEFFEDTSSLKNVGVQICKEYDLDGFAYVSEKNDKMLSFINKKGNDVFKVESLSPGKNIDYFLHFLASPSKKYICRKGILWLANAPKSLAEAYKRLGELFFK